MSGPSLDLEAAGSGFAMWSTVPTQQILQLIRNDDLSSSVGS
jgi:hypothetical protein